MERVNHRAAKPGRLQNRGRLPPPGRHWLLFGLALVVCLSRVSAQQQAPQPAPVEPQSSPSAVPPPSNGPQQPSSDAQLRTGTTSGLNLEERIQILLADHQFSQIESQLDQLPSVDAQLYRGILANRSNDLAKSVQLLEPLIDSVSASGNSEHEKLLRKALSEDYLRLGNWAKAAQAYKTLDSRLHAKLTADELDEIQMPLKMLPLARNNPPMTVDPCDPFKLQVTGNPLGLVDIPVFVDARSRNWMFDPTAPFNLIARSVARDAGLDISADSVTITTLTGRPIQVHVTVIPRFTVGGRLTFHDMTAFVFDDKDYYFPATDYQVEGVLGYPALAGLGAVTVSSDNTLLVRPAKPTDPGVDRDLLTTGARFYLDGDQVIVALGNASRGDRQPEPPSQPASAADDRMFVVDAGGQQTYLTSRYFDEHAADFNNQKMEMFSFPGAQTAPQPAYVAETVPLAVGSMKVDLHYLRVLTQPSDSAGRDDVYGVLGIDALEQLKSYTFDYRTMRFTVQAETDQ